MNMPDFELYPYCSEHGAMNKVSKYGLWRCLECHIGYNEKTQKVLKDSSEGFVSSGDKLPIANIEEVKK